MIYSQLSSEADRSYQAPRSNFPWLITGLFATIVMLELVSLADYVFSYLYIGPILLANLRLNRRIAIRLTGLACFLTLFNLWIPGSHLITSSTIANRVIAVAALVVTEILGYQNRSYEEAIAQHRVKLQFQEKLANLREDFASTLTHDLKTPLLGGIETLKALQRGQFGNINADQQRVLSVMVRSHQASLQMVETVLDVYRNDAEGIQLQRSPIHLPELVAQEVTALRELASTYQVSIHLNSTGWTADQVRVYGDAFQIQRVLSNLLINAIYHSPVEGQIQVMVEPQWDADVPQLLVKVLDDGPGIRPEALPNLFERFYQGVSDRQAKGSGLGLYLCRQIVEAHGGTIWAENGLERGALFGVSLPAYVP